MLNSIKKYFKQAKEENSREHTLSSSHGEIPEGKEALPKIWTGVDLDGTLAYYDSTSTLDRVGEPIPAMLDLVRKMLNNGIRVKIFTARAQDPDQLPVIRKWLRENNLPELEITNIKDYYMQRLYDDRCIQVEKNTGRLIVDI